MGQLRDRMVHDFELAGYVPHTRLVYVNSIRDFAAYHRRSPALLGADDVRAWIEKLKADGKIGTQRLRQHMAALKFLYTKTLWKRENVSFLSWPTDAKTLPHGAEVPGVLHAGLRDGPADARGVSAPDA